MASTTTSVGLLIGIGLRILLARISPSVDGPNTQNLLAGAWQGVLLFYTVTSFPHYLSAVLIGVATRYLVDLLILKDVLHSARSVLGVTLGALLAGLCSQLWDWDREDMGAPKLGNKLKSRKHRTGLSVPQSRLDVISEEESDLSSIARRHTRTDQVNDPAREAISSLRARAAAAAGDKQRLQEERKWALSQGNWARVSQLGWQIRRYEALRDSFEREAKRRNQNVIQLPPRRIVMRPSVETKGRFQQLSNMNAARQQAETRAIRQRTISEPSRFSPVRPSSAPPSRLDNPRSVNSASKRPLNLNLSSLDLHMLLPPLNETVKPSDAQDQIKVLELKDQFQRFPRSQLRADVPSGAPGYGVLNLVETAQRKQPQKENPSNFDKPRRPVVTLLADSPPLSPILLVAPQTAHFNSV